MNSLKAPVLILLAGIAGLVLPASSQVPAYRPGPAARPTLTEAEVAAFRHALNDSGRVTLEIHLSRKEYLAHEIYGVTLAASNSTGGPLLVFDPFDIWTACLDKEAWIERPPGNREDPWVTTNPDNGCTAGIDPKEAHTIPLAPGQRIERTLPSVESSLKPLGSQVSGGRYRMAYCYKTPSVCAYAEFTVP